MGSERGRIMVLTVGFFVLIGLLTVVVIDASQVYLSRRDLDNIADRAALFATGGVDRGSVYGAGAEDVALTEAEARAAVAVAIPDDVSMSLKVAGPRVHVRLERTVRLAISPPGWPVSADVVAEADGQIRIGRDG